jgi:hypothetical protein
MLISKRDYQFKPFPLDRDFRRDDYKHELQYDDIWELLTMIVKKAKIYLQDPTRNI